MDFHTDGQAPCLQGPCSEASCPRPLPPNLKQSERFFPSQNPALKGFPVAECGIGVFSGGKKASASKSAAVREVFLKPKPGVERFPVAEFGVGGLSGGRKGLWRAPGVSCGTPGA